LPTTYIRMLGALQLICTIMLSSAYPQRSSREVNLLQASICAPSTWKNSSDIQPVLSVCHKFFTNGLEWRWKLIRSTWSWPVLQLFASTKRTNRGMKLSILPNKILFELPSDSRSLKARLFASFTLVWFHRVAKWLCAVADALGICLSDIWTPFQNEERNLVFLHNRIQNINDNHKLLSISKTNLRTWVASATSCASWMTHTWWSGSL